MEEDGVVAEAVLAARLGQKIPLDHPLEDRQCLPAMRKRQDAAEAGAPLLRLSNIRDLLQ